MVPLLAALLLGQSSSAALKMTPPPERFGLEAPLTSVSGVMLDEYEDGMGLAQQMAKAHHLQGRIMWIDGTANLDKVNSEDKIVALMKQLASVGFNTVVFDIKPISGQVLYNSKIAPKIAKWRPDASGPQAQTLPEDFDPLPVMVREAHANGLMLLVSMNAFSEGHSLFRVGPGYRMPERQSVLYVPVPVVKAQLVSADLSPTVNSNAADDKVHVVTDPSKLRAGPKIFVSAVKANGYVMDGQMGGVPPLPKGGHYFVGAGTAAQFLQEHGRFGDVLTIDSRPEFLRSAQHPDQYPLMMNPNDPAVQDRMLAIIHEVVKNYDVDGVLFDDRLRYAGMDADFSELSRQMFENWLHQPIKWPDDAFKVSYSNTLSKGIQPGPDYAAWMTWRALQIRNWISRVRNEVNRDRKGCLFGIYCGSWFGEYPEFGSNYGAEDLQAGFWFLTPQYAKTGFAGLLDFIITGCYYQTPTIYEAMKGGASIGSTVEAAGQLSNRVADDQCWSFAGIALDSFAGNPEGLQNALQAACGSTQGVMVFDLSHNIEPMYPAFAQAFHFKAVSPLSKPAELAHVRRLRKRYRQLGAQERPVVISAGSSGTGF